MLLAGVMILYTHVQKRYYFIFFNQSGFYKETVVKFAEVSIK